MQSDVRVVVIGGSFAGLQVATELAGRVDVVVIDQRDFWEFTPSIHTCIAGGRNPESLLVPLANLCTFVQGAVQSIDFERSVVILDHEERFDFLVVATGCSYASPIRPRVHTRVERLQELREVQRTLTTAQSVLIVGGGAVGVELCGELANKKCILATTELVPDLPVQDKVLRTLKSRGVQVHFARARRLSETTFDVGGEEVEVDACLWCFGGRPQTAFLRSDLLDDRGFVAIDPYRRSLKFPQMYACGDVASKSDGQRLASYAHIEGEYVAHHILGVLRGREISPYSPPPRFVALSLGPRDGCFVYDSIAFPMPGFLVPWLKGLIEAWFIRLLPMPYALLSLLPGDVTARTWSKRPRTVS